MKIKARYEDGKFVPMEETVLKNIDNGEVVELQLSDDRIIWSGALKDMAISSVELQHQIKDKW
tara:strand:+ start:63 stop:251 length:189 start_codon:yes stop_codon:yes gene_type:complete